MENSPYLKGELQMQNTINIDIVRRDDGKIQLTKKGVQQMQLSHSCGMCRYMYAVKEGLRCGLHDSATDMWVVNPTNYGCSHFENKTTPKSYQLGFLPEKKV